MLAPLRALVCAATVAMALSPLAGYAATDAPLAHQEAERANAAAQLDMIPAQVAAIQQQVDASAANERMQA